jgi:hypothetical protein
LQGQVLATGVKSRFLPNSGDDAPKCTHHGS